MAYLARQGPEPQISAEGTDSCVEMWVGKGTPSTKNVHLPEGKREPLFKANAITVLRGWQGAKAKIYKIST